jgi:hypothetical protein
MAEISGDLASEYALRTNRDMARVNQQAWNVSAAHEATRSRQRSAVAALNSQRSIIDAMGRKAVGMREAAAQIADNQSRRFRMAIRLIEQLDAAAAANYRPILSTGDVDFWRSVGPQRTQPFQVDDALWRIGWAVAGGTGGSQLKIEIQNAETGTVLTRLVDDDLPHGDFSIRDEAGTFRLNIISGPETEYIVTLTSFDLDPFLTANDETIE